ASEVRAALLRRVQCFGSVLLPFGSAPLPLGSTNLPFGNVSLPKHCIPPRGGRGPGPQVGAVGRGHGPPYGAYRLGSSRRPPRCVVRPASAASGTARPWSSRKEVTPST